MYPHNIILLAQNRSILHILFGILLAYCLMMEQLMADFYKREDASQLNVLSPETAR